MKRLFKDGMPSLPDDVWIVAPGLKGRRAFDKIPAGACVIAVNRAIDAPVEASYFLAGDRGLTSCDFWRDNIGEGSTRIFSYELAEAAGGDCCEFVFNQSPALNHRDCAARWGALRAGATVVGQALQFCKLAGPQQMTARLVGVDMTGSRYFTGESVPEYEVGDCWAHARAMLTLMLRELGDELRVVAMTPTALKLKHEEF